MKNYELIEELCKLPAGAEVEINGVFDETEVIDMEEEERNLFGVIKDVESVETFGENRIFLN